MENACFQIVNSSEQNVQPRKMAVNGRIHAIFRVLTER